MDKKYTDSEIIEAWQINAGPWIKAIGAGEIESRLLVTNKAIIDAVLNGKPRNILDIGCGEGWLAAELSAKGINVFGIDAVPALIERAQQIKGGTFAACTYENLSSYEFNRRFDCLICNFSLIGEKSTESVIAAAGKLLEPGGRFLIQTLHPVAACGALPYQDGWREGSWAGFSKDFTRPAPWYFRTQETWKNLFSRSGLEINAIHEPAHPRTGNPASVIFDLSNAKSASQ
ncbi:MAG: methyltransferase domain-containing protein [Alphaproteobacteria bacterium]|nr:methyltransferase domain-containing protein [Alphaproteobacteria bacterium]